MDLNMNMNHWLVFETNLFTGSIIMIGVGCLLRGRRSGIIGLIMMMITNTSVLLHQNFLLIFIQFFHGIHNFMHDIPAESIDDCDEQLVHRDLLSYCTRKSLVPVNMTQVRVGTSPHELRRRFWLLSYREFNPAILQSTGRCDPDFRQLWERTVASFQRSGNVGLTLSAFRFGFKCFFLGLGVVVVNGFDFHEVQLVDDPSHVVDVPRKLFFCETNRIQALLDYNTNSFVSHAFRNEAKNLEYGATFFNIKF